VADLNVAATYQCPGDSEKCLSKKTISCSISIPLSNWTSGNSCLDTGVPLEKKASRCSKWGWRFGSMLGDIVEEGFKMKSRLLFDEVIEIGGDIGGGMLSRPGELGRHA